MVQSMFTWQISQLKPFSCTRQITQLLLSIQTLVCRLFHRLKTCLELVRPVWQLHQAISMTIARQYLAAHHPSIWLPIIPSIAQFFGFHSNDFCTLNKLKQIVGLDSSVCLPVTPSNVHMFDMETKDLCEAIPPIECNDSIVIECNDSPYDGDADDDGNDNSSDDDSDWGSPTMSTDEFNENLKKLLNGGASRKLFD